MSCMWILEDNDIWDLEEHENKDRLHLKNDLRNYSNGEVLIILFRWVVVEGTGRFFCLFPIYFLDLWFIQPIMCPSIQRREFILYPPTSQAKRSSSFSCAVYLSIFNSKTYGKGGLLRDAGERWLSGFINLATKSASLLSQGFNAICFGLEHAWGWDTDRW